jgi:pyridoxal biosynthesis lyase PdxS
MIRSKGEAGTGGVSNATTHMGKIGGEIRRLTSLSEADCTSRQRNYRRSTSWWSRWRGPASCP